MKPQTLTIADIHEGYRTKQFSVSELLSAYQTHIAVHDPQIKAFLTTTFDFAQTQAQNLDKQLTSTPQILEQQPLFGIPVGLKDVYLTEGIRTTAASKVLDTYIPQYSSTAWVRLQEAGAVLIGKLNCDAWAHGSSGENSDYFPTHNPWNTEYVPGGSSSGSAAAVAAGFSPIATGTDTGGSIRLPASFCGVVGLKPTYGRVSRYGITAMASSLDSIGHFSKTVADSARVLSVTAGSDPYDATTPPQPVPDYLRALAQPLPKLTIGLPKEFFADGLDPQVANHIQNAIKILESKFPITFKHISLPSTQYGVAVYYVVQTSEVSSNLGRYTGVRYGNTRDTFGAEAKRRIMLGTYTLSAGYYDAYYKKAMQVRTLIVKDYQQAFSQVDAILAPVSATPAFKLGAKSDDPLQMYLTDIFTITANLSGNPGLSIPCGCSDTGLPIGFQLLGPHFSESLLFQIGHAYQQVTDHHLQTPTLKLNIGHSNQ